MIFESIMNGSAASFTESLIIIIFMVIVSFLSITLRNYVQAALTVKFGGEATKTLNPIKALNFSNIFSVAILVLFSAGWTNPPKQNLSSGKNAMVALSAPLTSAVLAIASMLIYDILKVISVNYYIATESNPIVLNWISMFFSTSVLTNLAFMVFGLLPIPGTDGGLLIAQILPEKTREKFLYFDKFSYLILIFIALVAARSGITGTVLNAIASTIESAILTVMNIFFPVN